MRVTAAGSLPGDDFRGALGAMADALPALLPLPELPARGVTSGMVGRTLGLVEGLGFDLQPAGWRLTSGSGAQHRRARAQWRSDLDDAEELLQGFDGVLKVGLAGPWTLAATVERPRGDKVLADHGARRELAQALADGRAELFSELRRRLPSVSLLLQVDEPLLVSVAAGAVPTASGFSRHRAVDAPALTAALAPFAVEGALLHCCAAGDWLPVARAAGFEGAAVDTRWFRTPSQLDALGEWLAEGHALVAGVVDSSTNSLQTTDQLVTEALRVLRPLELEPSLLADRLVLGTGCGLAGWSINDVSPQLERLVAAAVLVAEALAH